MLPDLSPYQSPQASSDALPLGWRTNVVVKLLLGFVVVLGLAAMFPIGGPRGVMIPEGSVWNGQEVIAEFSFPINRSDAAYSREVDSATAAVPPVFSVDARTEEVCIREVSETIDLVRTNGQPAEISSSNPDATVSLNVALAAARGVTPERSEVSLLVTSCADFLADAFRHGVIDVSKTELHSAAIVSRIGHNETIHPIDSIFDVDEIAARLNAFLENRHTSEPLRELAVRAARAYVQANFRFDTAATAIDERYTSAAVPRTSGIVARGERIIARGERVDGAALERLNAWHAANTIRGEEHSGAQFAGAAVQMLLIVLLVVFYLFTLRRKLLADSQQLLIFALIVIFEALLAFASMRFGGGLPIEYLIVVPVAAMLGTILFDSRTGFFLGVVASLIAAGIRGGDYIVALGAIAAAGLAAYTVRDIRSRTQLFKSIGYIFLGYGFTIIASALERDTPTGRMGLEFAFALLNAVFSPVLTYALLIVFERGFNLTSDLTLLEFDNINHPLLKELSTEAPGTFHHTMVIADMAERAANAIGANAILAKVGAYYHDIGKISSPDFFVENQLGMRNKHERLTPLHSARIIMQHVPDGLALAAKHKVPQKIMDFIPMHHGTTMIAFFFDRALRRRRREDVRQEDYRYAGPKPRSKETAIVMLADSVEATIRSTEALDEPAIEKIVDRTIRNRFLEGQLDECELTAADLTAIRDQFVEILIGIHHPRIKYPDQISGEGLAPVESIQPASEQAPPSDQQDVPPPTDMPAEHVEPHEDPI